MLLPALILLCLRRVRAPHARSRDSLCACRQQLQAGVRVDVRRDAVGRAAGGAATLARALLLLQLAGQLAALRQRPRRRRPVQPLALLVAARRVALPPGAVCTSPR